MQATASLEAVPIAGFFRNLPHSTKRIFSTCFGSDSGMEVASEAFLEAILEEACLGTKQLASTANRRSSQKTICTILLTARVGSACGAVQFLVDPCLSTGNLSVY